MQTVPGSPQTAPGAGQAFGQRRRLGRPVGNPNDRVPPAAGPNNAQDEASRRRDKRRLWMWVAFLATSPLCLGVVVWAAISWNGSYPTVAPPVPQGWQAVAGIYASFSAPKGWGLQQGMSDAQGDTYYSGRGGGAGESVTQADNPPAPAHKVPAVVATFLGGSYQVTSVVPRHVRNAQEAWSYRFELPGGKQAVGVLAWVKRTESKVWLVALPASPTAEKLLSTLTLAT